MKWNEDKLRASLGAADTDDLLDRVTAYRAGMEVEAVALIEKELQRRGVSATRIAEHREACDRSCVFLTDGVAAMCSFCRKPAVKRDWGFHKIMGVLPVFPRRFYYCAGHV